MVTIFSDIDVKGSTLFDDFFPPPRRGRQMRPPTCFDMATTLRILLLLVLSLTLVGCSRHLNQDASLNSAEFHGKSQAWFIEHWGKPRARAKRFFGGETWMYFRIADGTRSFPFLNVGPAGCQMSLAFDKEGKLEDSASSGC